MFADVWPAGLISSFHSSWACGQDVPGKRCDVLHWAWVNNRQLGLPDDIKSSSKFWRPFRDITCSQNKNYFILWSVFNRFLQKFVRTFHLPQIFPKPLERWEVFLNTAFREVSQWFAEWCYSNIYSYKNLASFWRRSVWFVFFFFFWTVNLSVLDPMKHYRMLGKDHLHVIKVTQKNQVHSFTLILYIINQDVWGVISFIFYFFVILALANVANG